MTTAQDLEAKVAAGELTKLHTSYVRTYVSRKSGEIVRPYKGKFGEGFALLSPNWDSSRYSYITYYVCRYRRNAMTKTKTITITAKVL
ncbi:MAG: hypothetical protein WBJ84_05035 [Bacteroidales bacterium]